MARKQMTSEEVAEMWQRYRGGETVAMLARRFDRTTSGIGSKIRQAGGARNGESPARHCTPKYRSVRGAKYRGV